MVCVSYSTCLLDRERLNRWRDSHAIAASFAAGQAYGFSHLQVGSLCTVVRGRNGGMIDAAVRSCGRVCKKIATSVRSRTSQPAG